ncbi:hypothetical protein [Blastococcus sp. URHD0036]|uniref:hypothetical protein n=1 Tax=Blastococcus sp. URHD0036 TaxID=1380356 RepID=UPI000497F139|nr:hypothetical protein [Blastococcus sp. URHD0036]
MVTQKEPSPEALANVTEDNIRTRSELLPEEKAAGAADGDPGMAEAAAEVILAESEERTVNPDPDDAQGGHRQSSDTADLP